MIGVHVYRIPLKDSEFSLRFLTSAGSTHCLTIMTEYSRRMRHPVCLPGWLVPTILVAQLGWVRSLVFGGVRNQ